MTSPADLEAIIALLNELITAELTSINQYFLHAKILESQGFLGLTQHIRKESIDEMKHAEALIDRVLYLDGLPNLQRFGRLRVGESLKEIMTNDLALEEEAIPRFVAAIDLCNKAGDHGTRGLLERILADEEIHRDWLKTQLDLIERLGEQVYGAEHIRA